jgi:hypothetical protein
MLRAWINKEVLETDTQIAIKDFVRMLDDIK